MLSRLLFALAGSLMLTGSALQAQDAYRVIVNPANPTSTLTTSQVAKLFLERGTWDDGKPVLPVDLSTASPVRELFSKDVFGGSAASVAARAAADGQPPVLGSDADVIQFVRLKLGAIGYVSPAADLTHVKVISIVRHASAATTAGSDDRLVEQALSTYVSALEARDLDALKRIWPAMTAAQARAIGAEFGHARALRVELVDPRIEVKDGKAVVVARRRYGVTTNEGTKLESASITTLNLRLAATGWVIEGVRYQAEQ